MHGRKEASARNIDNAYVAVGGHIDFDGEPLCAVCLFFFSSRRRHTRFDCDWSSDVCSSDLDENCPPAEEPFHVRSRMTAWQIMCLRHRVAPAAGPISSDRTLGDGTLKRPMLQIGRAVV